MATRVLESPARDLRMIALPEGTTVLFNKYAPDEMMPFTDENKRRFESQGQAWTETTRNQIWMPSGSAKLAVERIGGLKANFMTAMDTNLRDRNPGSVFDHPLPTVRLPWWFNWLPFEPKIKRVLLEDTPEITEGWIAWIKKEYSPPGGDHWDWSSEWDAALRQTNEIRVYRLIAGALALPILVAFIHIPNFQRDDQPGVEPFDRPQIEFLKKKFREFLLTTLRSKKTFRFVSVAGPWCTDAKLEPLADSEDWEILSSIDESGKWAARMRETETLPVSKRIFVEKLTPRTWRNRVSEIRSFLVTLLDEGYQGSVDKEISRRAGAPIEQVQDAILLLQDEFPDVEFLKGYSNNIIATRSCSGRPSRIAPRELKQSWFKRHAITIIGAIVAAVLGTCFFVAKSYLQSGILPGVQAVGLFFLIAFPMKLGERLYWRKINDRM